MAMFIKFETNFIFSTYTKRGLACYLESEIKLVYPRIFESHILHC